MINKNKPLVSIVCLCYNHKPFVEEAINSVLEQDYPNIELIVVDDASDDGSGQLIKSICGEKNIPFIINSKNLGNCAAFNIGYELCRGEYIIDLAADDVLCPARVRTGVEELEAAGTEYGVHYSDALIIDESGKELGLHNRMTSTIDPGEKMPVGDVFSEVLARYFICPPTIMGIRDVFEALGGYDESLSFEDFDFLVRSSRDYKFCYSPGALVKRRIVGNSKSQLQYHKSSGDIESIYRVCEKAHDLVQNKKERNALNRRLQYECRQAMINNHPGIVENYLDLMRRNGMSGISRTLYRITSQIYPMVFGK